MHRRHLLATPALLLPALARAEGAAQPLVLELFTSQSCSSCPPADALLDELSQGHPGLLPLSFHVTYWDNRSWRDPFSLQAATDRQRRYAATLAQGVLGRGQIYTPQLVIQGRRDAVGSDRGASLAAIAAEASRRRPPVPMALRAAATEAGLEVDAGPGRAEAWLIGFDERHVTQVRGGENGGRTLLHRHVVRGIARLGGWQGQPVRLEGARPPGERLAALLQGADGGILAAGLA